MYMYLYFTYTPYASCEGFDRADGHMDLVRRESRKAHGATYYNLVEHRQPIVSDVSEISKPQQHNNLTTFILA